MGVERDIPALIAEIDQITRLFHQLCNVPPEIRDLFSLVENSRQLLSLVLLQFAQSKGAVVPDGEITSGAVFRRFRSRLLDLEVFLNPNGVLHQSGPQSYIRHVVPWHESDIGSVRDFCLRFEGHIQRLDSDSQTLLSLLAKSDTANDEPPQASVSPPNMALADRPPQRMAASRAITPASLTPTMTPKSRPSPLPSYLKAEEQEIMAKFIGQYFPPAAGAKRKRLGNEPAKTPQQPFGTLSPLVQSLPFPPGDLGDVPFPAGGIGLRPDGLNPTWMFEEIQSALPTLQPTPQPPLTARPQPLTAKAKGKQRAVRIEDVAQPAEFSSNSSGSVRSLPMSCEGSVFSANSQNRVFQAGSTKLWHSQGRSVKSLPIEHIEVRRNDRVSGEGIAIVCRTESGQEVIDDLWMASAGINSSPFIENSDISKEYRQRDSKVKFVVAFAPNPKHHPQYSFSTKEDCWDFMQAITDKILCASIDVESIKSACTHGNSSESSCQTLQIWDDTIFSIRTVKFFRNKNEGANPRIVDVNVNCFRCPDDGKRSRKLTVWLRDVLEGSTKDMKYLKLVFSTADGEEEFLQMLGFGIPSMSI